VKHIGFCSQVRNVRCLSKECMLCSQPSAVICNDVLFCAFLCCAVTRCDLMGCGKVCVLCSQSNV
jgi:hypothetical protein